ncbi:hypothetical protein M9Y10_037063 [Tritrichomonas musculus]|uniref:Protein kinase domain-containing protein n=1 Tax=Tritrichomonas musculus TaxID=1915356 RepID=A0ABR2GTP6_9EUKA
MKRVQIKQLEMKDICFTIRDMDKIISKFTIYNKSKIEIGPKFIRIRDQIQLKDIMHTCDINTGIFISFVDIENIRLFILIFDNTIFIVEPNDLCHYQETFNQNYNCLIFFSNQVEKEFTLLTSQDISYIGQDINIKIDQKTMNVGLKDHISQCIITKSQYITLKKRQNLLHNNTKYIKKNYELNDFVTIKNFSLQDKNITLRYNINDQSLYILKSFNSSVYSKFDHESQFFEKIANYFHYIEKIYGTIEFDDIKYLVLEYVEGETLKEFIKNENLDFSQKLKIILEILLSVEFIHSQGIVLRDLKWDNIIIDSSLDAILIDFDSSKQLKKGEENTADIGSLLFTPPEQSNSNDYSYKVDVYSIGVIIHYIITGELYNSRNEKNNDNSTYPKDFEAIFNLYVKCFAITPLRRPNISELINNLIKIILSEIDTKIDEKIKSIIFYRFYFYSDNCELINNNDVESFIDKSQLFFFMGIFYYFKDPIEINKSIFFLKLSSDYNNSDAQSFLGGAYLYCPDIQIDVNKSIHYLSLSAGQNNSNAQYMLGSIYVSGKFVKRDIKKAIYYLTLSANQNVPEAQYLLGTIYFSGMFFPIDIEKSIHYLSLAAKSNISDAQFLLGYIYSSGEYVPVNMNIAIDYLIASSNNNNSKAQCYLGLIYYTSPYIQHDIMKSVHYFTLASNQNYSDAQYFLGSIYYSEGNISKAIYYLNLASNQNNSDSH